MLNSAIWISCGFSITGSVVSGAENLARAFKGLLMALSDRIPGDDIILMAWAAGSTSHGGTHSREQPASCADVLSLVDGLWGQAALLPTVALTCVWFWSLFRPSAMAPPVVFVIGLLLDLLGSLPLGVGEGDHVGYARSGLGGYGGSFPPRNCRRFRLVFTTVACGIATLNWALVSLLTFSFIPPGPVLFQAGLAAAISSRGDPAGPRSSFHRRSGFGMIRREVRLGRRSSSAAPCWSVEPKRCSWVVSPPVCARCRWRKAAVIPRWPRTTASPPG